MNRRAWAAITVLTASMLTATGLALAGTIGSHHAAACHLAQSVFSSTYQPVGTWRVTLPAGQSVQLPDGDTATCTGSEDVTVR